MVGLVPARGGSKQIPRKNARLLGGRPLLSYTADAALRARRLERVILSTEDDEIADIGRRCGLDVPFRRPPELALDETPMLAVVQHALAWLEEKGDVFDAVCLLQPTSPLRSSADIDACVALCEQSGADAVVTVLSVPPQYNPHWVYFRSASGTLGLATGEDTPISRRQDLPPAFHREGSVYVTRWGVIRDQRSLYGRHLVGYPIEDTRSINLDTPEDWSRAESRLAKRKAGACAG